MKISRKNLILLFENYLYEQNEQGEAEKSKPKTFDEIRIDRLEAATTTTDKIKKDSNFKKLTDTAQDSFLGLALMKTELKSKLGISNSDYKLLCKTALGIQGRESSFGSSKSYYAETPFEAAQAELNDTLNTFFKDTFAIDDIVKTTSQGLSDQLASIDPRLRTPVKTADRVDPSIGPSQIVYRRHFKEGEPLHNFAKSIALLGPGDLYDPQKSIFGTLAIINRLYYLSRTRIKYSTTKPGVNAGVTSFDSTGNAALDLAIASYNSGYGSASNESLGWCGKGPKKTKCTKSSKDQVKNYIPNFRSTKAPITTIGYIEEVAGYINDFAWMDAYL